MDSDLPTISSSVGDLRSSIMRLKNSLGPGQSLPLVHIERVRSMRAMLTALVNASLSGTWVHRAMANDFRRGLQALEELERLEGSEGGVYHDVVDDEGGGGYVGGGYEGGSGFLGRRSYGHGRGGGCANAVMDALLMAQHSLALLVVHHSNSLQQELMSCQERLAQAESALSQVQADKSELLAQHAAQGTQLSELMAMEALLSGALSNSQAMLASLTGGTPMTLREGCTPMKTIGGYTCSSLPSSPAVPTPPHTTAAAAAAATTTSAVASAAGAPDPGACPSPGLPELGNRSASSTLVSPCLPLAPAAVLPYMPGSPKIGPPHPHPLQQHAPEQQQQQQQQQQGPHPQQQRAGDEQELLRPMGHAPGSRLPQRRHGSACAGTPPPPLSFEDKLLQQQQQQQPLSALPLPPTQPPQAPLMLCQEVMPRTQEARAADSEAPPVHSQEVMLQPQDANAASGVRDGVHGEGASAPMHLHGGGAGWAEVASAPPAPSERSAKRFVPHAILPPLEPSPPRLRPLALLAVPAERAAAVILSQAAWKANQQAPVLPTAAAAASAACFVAMGGRAGRDQHLLRLLLGIVELDRCIGQVLSGSFGIVRAACSMAWSSVQLVAGAVWWPAALLLRCV